MSRSNFIVLSAVVGLSYTLFSEVQADQDDVSLKRLRLNSFWRLVAPSNAFYDECPGESACAQLPVDPEIAFGNVDFESMTEYQLRVLCRDAKAVTTCYYQQENCIPSDFQPLVEPLNRGLAKLFEVCDQPSLYTDYQTVKMCARSLIDILSSWDRFSFLSSNSMFTVCPHAAFIAGKSAANELERIDAVANRWSADPFWYRSDAPTTSASTVKLVVNATEIQHGACCAGKAVVECGLTTMISEICTTEATAVIQKHLDHILSSFNCSQATANRPCPLVINLAQ